MAKSFGGYKSDPEDIKFVNQLSEILTRFNSLKDLELNVDLKGVKKAYDTMVENEKKIHESQEKYNKSRLLKIHQAGNLLDLQNKKSMDLAQAQEKHYHNILDLQNKMVKAEENFKNKVEGWDESRYNTEKMMIEQQINEKMKGYESERKELIKNYDLQAKKTEQLISLYENRLSDAQSNASELLEDSLEKVFKNVGANLESTISTALQGGFDGVKTLFEDSLKGVRSVIDFQAVKKEKAGDTQGSANLLQLSKGIGMASMAITGLVTVFKMMLDMDAKIKEFNKGIIDNLGGMEIAGRQFGGTLSQNLNELRGAFYEGAIDLGLSAETIQEKFTALTESGIRLKDLGSTIKDSSKTGVEMVGLLNTYSRDLGITFQEASEYANHLGREMGTSFKQDPTEQTNEGLDKMKSYFEDIRELSSQAGVSSKIFSTAIMKLTTETGNMNVRMVEAGNLMIKFSKTLGPKGAEAFLEGLKGIDTQGFAEIYKQIKLAGLKESKEIFEESAVATANEYLKKTTTKKEKALMSSALKEQGFDIDLEGLTPEELVEKLKKIDMSSDAFARVQAQVMAQDPEKGGQLFEQFRKMTQLATANAQDPQSMVNSARALDLTGQYKLMMAQVNKIGKGKRIHELSQVEREAFKGATGSDETKLQMLEKLSREATGQYSLVQKLASKRDSLNDGEKKMLENLGVYFDEDGKARNKETDMLIDSEDDFFALYAKNAEESGKGIKTEQEIAIEQKDATVSLLDVMNNNIAVILNDISSSVSEILNWIASWFGSGQSKEEAQTQKGLLDANTDKQKNLTEAIKEADTLIARIDADTKAGKVSTAGMSKEEVENKKQELKEQLAQARDDARILRSGKVKLTGTEEQQKQDLALATGQVKKGTLSENISNLYKNLAVTNEKDLLKKIGGYVDVLEDIQEGDADMSQLKPLEDAVKLAGLQIQYLESQEGFEYIQILDNQNKILYEAQEQGPWMDAKAESFIKKDYKAKRLTDEEQTAVLKENEGTLTLGEYSAFGRESGGHIKKTKGYTIEQQASLTAEQIVGEQKKLKEETRKKDLEDQIEAVFKGNKKSEDEKINEYRNLLTGANIDLTDPTTNAEFESHRQLGVEELKGYVKRKLGLEPVGDDFVFRNDGTIQRFSPQDNILGFKSGGFLGKAVNNVLGGGVNNTSNMGGTVNININGGNRDEIYTVVLDAMRRAGVVTEKTSRA
jgi:hypothetical protein